jgi:hypothetical protein
MLRRDFEIVAIHVQPIVNNRSNNPFAGYSLQPQSCHIELPEGSYDFNENVPEPRPLLLDDKHGTRCCGEIAVVGFEIVAIHVQPIVNNRSNNPFAGYSLQPQSCHTMISTRMSLNPALFCLTISMVLDAAARSQQQRTIRLVGEVDSRRFIDIINRLGQDPDAGYLAIVRNTR